jgi:hypothetical protein
MRYVLLALLLILILAAALWAGASMDDMLFLPSLTWDDTNIYQPPPPPPSITLTPRVTKVFKTPTPRAP